MSTSYHLFESFPPGASAAPAQPTSVLSPSGEPPTSGSSPASSAPPPPVSWQQESSPTWKQDQPVLQGPTFTGYRAPSGYLDNMGGKPQSVPGGFNPGMFNLNKIQEFQILAKLGAIQENYLANSSPRFVLFVTSLNCYLLCYLRSFHFVSS